MADDLAAALARAERAEAELAELRTAPGAVTAPRTRGRRSTARTSRT